MQSTSDPGPPPPVHFPTREPAEAPSGQLGDDDVDALSSVSGDERDEPEERNADGTLGLQWSWLSHQVAVGPAAALGYERLWVDFEAIFLFTTRSAPERPANFLGNRLGLGVAYAVLDSQRFRGRLGLGCDYYALWGIHAQERKVALTAKADVTFWLSPNWGLELGVRGYPVASSGLDVRRGPPLLDSLPLFFTTTLLGRAPGNETAEQWR